MVNIDETQKTAFRQSRLQGSEAWCFKDVLDRLTNLERILYVGAHPDDENNRLLSYLNYGKGCEVAYLSLTRGEGGQNLIGAEYGLDLGMLREMESIAAGRVDGARRFFTRASDFGFTESSKEAFDIWEKEGVLQDIVWCIRYYCPDIIISRFSPDVPDLHGQHNAAAELICRAYEISGDPSVFPEQLVDVGSWSADWIFWNVYSEAGIRDIGGEVEPKETYCSIEIPQQSDHICGMSYDQVAYLARRAHRSQDIGDKNVSYPKMEYFEEISGKSVDCRDFPLRRSKKYREEWSRNYLNYLENRLHRIKKSGTEELISFLSAAASLLRAINKRWTEGKICEIESIAIRASGVRLRAESNLTYWTGLEDVRVDFGMEFDCPDLKVRLLSFEVPALNKGQQIEAGTDSGYSAALYGRPDVLLMGEFIPFWYRFRQEGTLCDSNNSNGFVLPSGDLVQKAIFNIDINGFSIEATLPIRSLKCSDVGSVDENLVVARPPVLGRFDRDLSFTGLADTPEVILHLTSFVGFKVEAYVKVINSVSRESVTDKKTVTMNPGAFQEVAFEIPGDSCNTLTDLGFEVILLGKTYHQRMITLNSKGMPLRHYYPAARMKITRCGFSSLAKRIAYVEGSVSMTEALEGISEKVSVITAESMLNSDLCIYDAIILGPGIPMESWILRDFERICSEFIEKGGVLVCSYNSFYHEEELVLFDFKINKSRRRISNPRDRVVFQDPGCPIIVGPNSLNEGDFLHWEGDVAVRLPANWSSGMDSVLSGIDRNGQKVEGLLLLGRIGRGYLVYSCLTLFRHIRKGDELAFKLLSNIVSLGK